MTSILTLEQLRWICVSVISSLLAFFTPTATFVQALIVMFAFNIWAGMRADGVAICRCKNFSMSKFRKSIVELILYLVTILIVFTVMKLCGDEKPSLIAVKSLTYIYMYVYLQNSFKNLIIAYPEKKALHFVYHVIRLEFHRAMPEQISEIIDRYEKKIEEEEKNEKAQ